MNLRKLIFTNSDNYKIKSAITPKGIVVHSTGANNPELRRYVGPDDGLLGKNQYNNHWNMPMSRKVGMHGFIGKLANGSVATYQTLPWTHRAWHSGGKANDTHIGFEICEDNLRSKTYFDQVYMEAVEFCAFLCTEYNLNPLETGVVIGHYEGYKMGLASNHGDPDYWFKKHGKSMESLRADVSKLMKAQLKRKITTGNVNLREAPSVFYEVIGNLKKDTPINVLMTIGKWSYVNSGTDYGYIFNSYIGEIPESEPEPVSDPINGPFVNSEGLTLWFRAVAGSYDTRRACEDAIARLKSAGYEYAWMEAVKVDGQPWFRAHAGSHDRRVQAAAEVDKLVADGYKGAWLQAVYLQSRA